MTPYLAIRLRDCFGRHCKGAPVGHHITASLDTYTEGLPQVRLSDAVTPFGSVLTGSYTHWTNGLPTARRKDLAVCKQQAYTSSLYTVIFD